MKFINPLFLLNTFLITATLSAEIIVVDTEDLVTPAGGGDASGQTTAIGVWINANDIEVPPSLDVDRGAFIVETTAGIPNKTTLFPGRFQLIFNDGFDPPASQILLQSPIGPTAILGTSEPYTPEGSDIVTAVLSPARLDVGFTVDAEAFEAPDGTTDSNGESVTDLSTQFLEIAGTFGTFNPDLGRGFVGFRYLRLVEPGVTWTSYGYMDITVNPDFTITLNGFAVSTEADEPVTTAFIGDVSITPPVTVEANAVSARVVEVTWEMVSGVTGYTIERSPSGLDSFSVITDSLTAGETSYLDLTAQPETAYDYRILSKLGNDVSSPSAVATTTTLADTGASNAPTDLTATVRNATVIRLNWTDNSNDEYAFRILSSENGGSYDIVTELGANTTEYFHMSLTSGADYDYQIIALNGLESAVATASARTPSAASAIAADRVRESSDYNNVDGAGLTVGVWDIGQPRLSHVEFVRGNSSSVITSSENTDGLSSGHMTHTIGVIAGSGVVPDTRGIAPAADIAAFNPNVGFSFDVDYDTEVVANGASFPNDPLTQYISNHSYSVNSAGWEPSIDFGVDWIFFAASTDGLTEDPEFGQYNNFARDSDVAAYNVPYHLMVRSAGNDREDNPEDGDNVYLSVDDQVNFRVSTYDSSDPSHPKPDNGFRGGFETVSSEALAKNVLTVGGLRSVERDPETGVVTYISETSDVSCWGPTDEGRIKPDVVALGVNIRNAGPSPDITILDIDNNTVDDPAGDTLYSLRSGTSFAAASVTGGATLLLDYFDTLFPAQQMRASTLKGLIIHTADDAETAGPDYKTGWGLMNTKAAADHIKAHHNNPLLGGIIEGRLFAENTSDTYQFTVDGSEEFKVTLVWTDPPGVATSDLNSRDSRIVNDLNLRILSDSDVTFYPYIMPFGLSSAAALDMPATTAENNIDTVEQVRLSSPSAGTYTVIVDYDGSLTHGEQFYSLIISGASAQVNQGEPSVQLIELLDSNTLRIIGSNFSLGSAVDVSPLGQVLQNTSPLGVEVTPNEIFVTIISGALENGLYGVTVTTPDNQSARFASPVRVGLSGRSFADFVSESFNFAQLTQVPVSGLLSNPDKDLYINFEEYVFGLDPFTPDHVPSFLIHEGEGDFEGIPLYEFSIDNDIVDVNIIPQVLSDLNTDDWETLIPVDDLVHAPVDNLDGTTSYTFRDKVDNADYVRLFRLQMTFDDDGLDNLGSPVVGYPLTAPSD